MDPLNKELLRLIKQIKEQPANSRIARKAKNQLVKTILESRTLIGIYKLRQLNREDGVGVNLSKEDLETLRLLALAETLNRLDKYDYDPERPSVMAWVNWKVKNTYRTKRNSLCRNERRSYQNRILLVYNFDFDFPVDFLALEAREEKETHRLLREFISEDPEKLLAGLKLTYINQETNAKESISLREVLLMLFEVKTLMNVHRKLNIPEKSLYSFMRRNLPPLKEKDTVAQKLRKQRIIDYFERYLR